MNKIVCSHCSAVIEDHYYYEISGQIICGDCRDNYTVSIDCNGNITRNTFVPEPFITGNKWFPQSAWYDDYLYEEELLLDNCKYYGVSEGAVTTLLAYGYTPTEVEDMLMDTTSLERSLRQVMYSDEAPPRKGEFYAQR